jgi:osmotically-inducible protein OsmY
VTQTTRSNDQDLRASVCKELLDTTGIDKGSDKLGVAVNRGVVTLSGEVGSLPERVAAKRAVMRVPGVTAVADDLQVRAAGTPATTDAGIARTASQLLGRATDVPAGTVTAEVHDHVVTLSGSVTWDYQRAAAVRAVRHINGVTAVTNTITLSRDEPVSIRAATVEQPSRRSATTKPTPPRSTPAVMS